MFRFVTIPIFLSLAVAIFAQKRTNVYCPEFVINTNKSETSVGKYFEQPGPADGICAPNLGGKLILSGNLFGYPGQTRCVCTHFTKSAYPKCGKDIPECPRIPAATTKSSSFSALATKRSALMKKNLVVDGCCPTGTRKIQVAGSDLDSYGQYCFCEDRKMRV